MAQETVPIPAEPVSVTINATYYSNISWDVQLPEGRIWDDVQEAHIKWDSIGITWKDGTEDSIQMAFMQEDGDTKRPLSFTVNDDETGDDIVTAEGSSWIRGEKS